MTNNSVLQSWQESARQGIKKVLVLVDPDKWHADRLSQALDFFGKNGVSGILLGGSLLTTTKSDEIAKLIQSESSLPLILFPGHPLQLTARADAVLFLSLISGRNPDLLIGQHVHAAPLIKKAGLEPIPTGYILIGGSQMSSVEYMSGSFPIPPEKVDIAAATALAGMYLGMKIIYLEAGSGAGQTVSVPLINAVKTETGLPLIVGGGIRTKKQALSAFNAGADIVVLGTVVEENYRVISEISKAIKNH